MYTDNDVHEYTDERMTPGFAVFNLHCNDAGRRADAEFIAQFGKEKFDKHIKPFQESGIMAIFEGPVKKYRLAWVTLCTAYVNENSKEAANPQPAQPDNHVALDGTLWTPDTEDPFC